MTEPMRITETLTPRSIKSITNALVEFGYPINEERVRLSANGLIKHGKTPAIGDPFLDADGNETQADIVDMFIARQLHDAGLIDRDRPEGIEAR